jgi:hypothetical protein
MTHDPHEQLKKDGTGQWPNKEFQFSCKDGPSFGFNPNTGMVSYLRPDAFGTSFEQRAAHRGDSSAEAVWTATVWGTGCDNEEDNP